MERSPLSRWRKSTGLALALLAPALVSCTSGVEPATIASIRVDVTTAGQSQDNDGYLVTVGAGATRPVENNGSVTFDPVSPGVHSMTVSDVDENCDVVDGPPRNNDGNFTMSLTVIAGETAVLTVEIICTAP